MKIHALAALALLASPAALAAEINVSYDPEFAEDLADEYGEREGAYLTAAIEKDISQALKKAGVDVARIDVIILDAKPTQPTFKQLSDRPGLDYILSKGIGGMKLSATMYDADGSPAGDLTYDWFETSIRDSGLATWSDAKRTSDRFARKIAKQLKGA